MKVVCEINNILEIKNDVAIERIKKYVFRSDGQLGLDKGKEYCVYGIAFRDNSPWYFLCLSEDDESPRAYPAELFRITDGRLSSYWKLSTRDSALVYEDWANDEYYLERLFDGDPLAIGQFKSFKFLMDCE